jgi:hypothetical protein
LSDIQIGARHRHAVDLARRSSGELPEALGADEGAACAGEDRDVGRPALDILDLLLDVALAARLDLDAIGEAGGARLTRARSEVGIAHQRSAPVDVPGREPVRPRARRCVIAGEAQRRIGRKHEGERLGQLVQEVGVGASEVDGDRPRPGVCLYSPGQITASGPAHALRRSDDGREPRGE